MIDFRYHLVSIVSVFLALAVGIVLGAGPLQGQIAETRTSESTQLRTDKQALREDVTTLTQEATVREAYDQAVVGRVVSGLAAGRGVAIVELPGADADLARSLASTVTAAGGAVASTTRVLDTWVSTDEAVRSAREELATRLAPTLRLSTPEVGAEPTTSSLADRVLAAALSSSSSAPLGSEAARDALTELAAAKLVEVDAKSVTSAQLVIVLTDPLAGTDKAVQAQAASYAKLIGALQAISSATVAVAGKDAETPKDRTSIIQTIRQDGTTSKVVTTVDDAETGMGLASVVLALAEAESGTSGHYGTADGATAAHPSLPKP